ncbi:hypothetical protein HerbRD11066_12910 [Herbidospora sp. RD11066]
MTVPLSRVALPAHASGRWGNDRLHEQLLEPGTYAVNPERSGPPWRPWEELTSAELESLGFYAPLREGSGELSLGPSGAIALCLGDLRGTAFIPDRLDGSCCGLIADLACASCGSEVALLIDDCGLWQVVWLQPGRVRGTGTDDPVLPWDDLGDVFARDRSEIPRPAWMKMAGAVTARLLAASGGVRLTVPDGASLFRDVLDVLLPPGPPERPVVMAGPGLPGPDADIALVPEHPQTDEVWRGEVATAVPVPYVMWRHMAFPDDARRMAIAATSMPRAALRDDPTPMTWFRITPDNDTFIETLVRLPEVRQPWLRAIYDRYCRRAWNWPFW